MDELFETLTLVQTKKIVEVPPIVLFESEFWNDVCDFDALVKLDAILPEDVGLFKIVDTVEEAHDFIVNGHAIRFLS